MCACGQKNVVEENQVNAIPRFYRLGLLRLRLRSLIRRYRTELKAQSYIFLTSYIPDIRP